MLSKEMIDSLDWVDTLSIEEIKELLVIDNHPAVNSYDMYEITKQYLHNLNN